MGFGDLHDVRPTGHLQIKGGPHGRVWYALWRDADGRHQRRLGPAHVRDSGRRTARGAIVWWAANGSKPSADHLTPAEADEALRELLADAVRAPTDRGTGGARTTRSARRATRG
jgi:hypothetical protein